MVNGTKLQKTSTRQKPHQIGALHMLLRCGMCTPQLHAYMMMHHIHNKDVLAKIWRTCFNCSSKAHGGGRYIAPAVATSTLCCGWHYHGGMGGVAETLQGYLLGQIFALRAHVSRNTQRRRRKQDSKHLQFLVAPFQLGIWTGPFPVEDMDRPLSSWGYGLTPFRLGIWTGLFPIHGH